MRKGKLAVSKTLFIPSRLVQTFEETKMSSIKRRVFMDSIKSML